MLNQIFVSLAVLSVVILFGYLTLWNWKDMKDHEQKRTRKMNYCDASMTVECKASELIT